MRWNTWWKNAPSSFHHFSFRAYFLTVFWLLSAFHSSLFQLSFKNVFHHDEQAAGSYSTTGHSLLIFLIHQIKEKFQIESFRCFLQFLPVSDTSQSRKVYALIELYQLAMRIAQFHYGSIGNAQRRFLMLLIICHDSWSVCERSRGFPMAIFNHVVRFPASAQVINLSVKKSTRHLLSSAKIQ